MRPYDSPLKRIELDNVIDRAVRANEGLHRRIRMPHRDLLESRIPRLFGGPIQERYIEHAIDNRPAPRIAFLQVIPSAIEAPCQIKAACQQIRSMERPLPRFRVSRHFVIRHAGWQPHKSNVMMQTVKFLKAPIQLGFGDLCDLLVLLVAGFMVHKPQHASPETVGPPANAVSIITRRIISASVVVHTVNRRIRNLVPGTFADHVHFPGQIPDDDIQPLPFRIIQHGIVPAFRHGAVNRF
ncbi:hypothetical protein D3C77_455310 [compost metagenome]